MFREPARNVFSVDGVDLLVFVQPLCFDCFEQAFQLNTLLKTVLNRVASEVHAVS